MAESTARAGTAAVLARFLAAFKARDLETVVGLISKDCVVESVASATLSGPEGIRQLYREWFKAFPDLAVHAQETVIDGDRGVLIVTAAGTDTGGFMGLPSTGKSFRIQGAIALTIADGLVVRYHSVYDFTGLLVQVGILKAKPAL